MRTFIAIPLPAETIAHLDRLQGDLQKNLGASVAWVALNSIHLTLKFLGEVEEKHISGLANEIKEACRQFEPFNLICKGMGCFPNARQARVIWAGIAQEKRLNDLQGAVENACFQLGFPREKRRFSPHLTLGRVRYDLSQVSVDYLDRKINEVAKGAVSPIQVNEVLLFKSELLRSGAKYTVLSRAELKTIPQ